MSQRSIQLSGDIAPSGPPEAASDIRQPPNERQAIMRQRDFLGCRHRKIVVDEEQRLVKCGACGLWLDPVWVLKELVDHYETRVDQRLEEIRAFEQKRADDQARKAARKHPEVRREEKKRTRQQELERAAHNRYQSELLRIRAESQEARAEKLATEIAALGKD